MSLLLVLILLLWASPVLAQSSAALSDSTANSKVGISPLSDSVTAGSSEAANRSTAVSLTESASGATSAQLFELHCAGCHIHGGNIVRRGKNLKLKTLQKYQMDSVEAIAQIITLGRGNMSAYQDRLTPDQIQTLAVYVLEQAQQNWP